MENEHVVSLQQQLERAQAEVLARTEDNRRLREHLAEVRRFPIDSKNDSIESSRMQLDNARDADLTEVKGREMQLDKELTAARNQLELITAQSMQARNQYETLLEHERQQRRFNAFSFEEGKVRKKTLQ